MYAEIVTLTVMLGCLLCIIHSWLYRGEWQTAGFFIGGFIFGIVRENVVSLLPGMYTYPNHPFYIGSAPLMMGFGWSASFYACWMVGNKLLEAYAPKWKDNRWIVPFVAAVITASLSLPVEVAAGASQTLWWVWPIGVIRVLFEMPAIVPFGWAGAAFLFIFLYRWADARKATPKMNALLFMVLTLMVIALHLVYVFIVRAIIVFLLA